MMGVGDFVEIEDYIGIGINYYVCVLHLGVILQCKDMAARDR